MILTGHQPNYLPYAGFFEKIARSDRFLVVDNVQFVKRGTFGWMHRNRIRSGSPEGWDWLSVPVLSKGRFHQKILEAEVDNSTPWARKHWRALEWNYRKAPHFATYAEAFREHYERPWKSFCELTCAFIELLLRLLGTPSPVAEVGSQDPHSPGLGLPIRRLGVGLAVSPLVVVLIAAHRHHTFSILAPERSLPGPIGGGAVSYGTRPSHTQSFAPRRIRVASHPASSPGRHGARCGLRTGRRGPSLPGARP
jgi:hypothetical protein